MKLLNPYSIKLEKNPFMTVESPIFKDGDFYIYQYYSGHFVHTFKNIVIAERVKPNYELVNNLVKDIKPVDEADFYFLYERPKEAIQQGIKAAKKLNFEIL